MVKWLYDLFRKDPEELTADSEVEIEMRTLGSWVGVKDTERNRRIIKLRRERFFKELREVIKKVNNE